MSAENVCEICEKGKPKYCCPKCNIFYCSLTCYKDEKHLQCSETFYRANVVEELQLQAHEKDPSKSKSQMLEMLARLQDQEEDEEELDSDDDDSEDLADRLKDVDLDDSEAVWSKLTDDERQQFQTLVDSGDIEKLMPVSEPWFVSSKNVPKIAKKIQDFSKISSKSPAPGVKFDLVNILAAYAYMTRYFLCRPEDFVEESCQVLCLLSPALRQSCDFQSLEMAIKAIYIEGLSHQFEMDEELQPTLYQDVEKMCGKADGEFVLAALSDIVGIFKKAKGLEKVKETGKAGKFSQRFPEQVNFDVQVCSKETRTKAVRRLEYFLAFTRTYYSKEIAAMKF